MHWDTQLRKFSLWRYWIEQKNSRMHATVPADMQPVIQPSRVHLVTALCAFKPLASTIMHVRGVCVCVSVFVCLLGGEERGGKRLMPSLTEFARKQLSHFPGYSTSNHHQPPYNYLLLLSCSQLSAGPVKLWTGRAISRCLSSGLDCSFSWRMPSLVGRCR